MSTLASMLALLYAVAERELTELNMLQVLYLLQYVSAAFRSTKATVMTIHLGSPVDCYEINSCSRLLHGGWMPFSSKLTG
jgi:hypothetical protein